MITKANVRRATCKQAFASLVMENKVKWINDSENNRYLHYALSLEMEKLETG